jgi:DNA-binding beta-propeller fold protein YncE
MKRIGLLVLLITIASATSLLAEKWVIETVAGTGVAGFSGDGGPALQAKINNPFGVVRGPDGSLWFCEYTGQRIRRITPDGKIESIAGTGKVGYTGDGGPALEATFNFPHEIRFDSAGDLYIVDMKNHAVRKIDMKTNNISTFAGTGKQGYDGDGGPADQSQLNQPHSIQFGPEGNLYVCDIGNHVIRLIDMKTKTISTFSGTGKPGDTPNQSPIEGTSLKGPRSIDFSQNGLLYLATREGNQVFRFDLNEKKIFHIAGTGKKGFTGNGGLAIEATLSGPKGIVADSEGHIWLADTESHSIRRINSQNGKLELMVGDGEKGDGPDGDPLKCRLARLHGIYADADGSIYIGDSENHRLRVLKKK